ncbi:MAG: hypothetical protein IJV89_03600, partial [Lentisphaeria bacterium]|nr:hypothetical protein [Lentisphaeria bacterium]
CGAQAYVFSSCDEKTSPADHPSKQQSVMRPILSPKNKTHTTSRTYRIKKTLFLLRDIFYTAL